MANHPTELTASFGDKFCKLFSISNIHSKTHPVQTLAIKSRSRKPNAFHCHWSHQHFHHTILKPFCLVLTQFLHQFIRTTLNCKRIADLANLSLGVFSEQPNRGTSKDLPAWWTRCSCDWSLPWMRRSRSLLAMQLGVLLLLPPPFPLASSSSPTPGSSSPFRYCFSLFFSRKFGEWKIGCVWELEWQNCRCFNSQQIFRNRENDD